MPLVAGSVSEKLYVPSARVVTDGSWVVVPPTVLETASVTPATGVAAELSWPPRTAVEPGYAADGLATRVSDDVDAPGRVSTRTVRFPPYTSPVTAQVVEPSAAMARPRGWRYAPLPKSTVRCGVVLPAA